MSRELPRASSRVHFSWICLSDLRDHQSQGHLRGWLVVPNTRSGCFSAGASWVIGAASAMKSSWKVEDAAWFRPVLQPSPVQEVVPSRSETDFRPIREKAAWGAIRRSGVSEPIDSPILIFRRLVGCGRTVCRTFECPTL